jgi:hypothetical protein
VNTPVAKVMKKAWQELKWPGSDEVIPESKRVEFLASYHLCFIIYIIIYSFTSDARKEQPRSSSTAANDAEGGV